MKTQPFIGVSILALGVFAFALSVAIITGSLPEFPGSPEQAEVIETDVTPVALPFSGTVELGGEEYTLGEDGRWTTEALPMPPVVIIVEPEPGAGAAKRRPERARAKSGESPQGPGVSAPSVEPQDEPDPFKRALPERESWGPVLRANTDETARSLKAPQAEAETYTFTTE